jgi:tetratricopeptide (TPR) repeat protein
MRRIIPLLFLIFVTCVVSNAQVTRLQARDAEWKSYQLPKTNFARQTSPETEFIFRVPADWKQQGAELIFEGPHAATLQVFVQKVPDGYPLQDFFATMLQTVKDTPGAAETVVTRKTQLQDLEARELFMELPDNEGEIFRSTSWVTVAGPRAITFNLKVPVAHAAEVEPFFKAVVQSVIFVRSDHIGFNVLRTTTVKTSAPGPIHEVENIVASLNEAHTDREAAVTRLASLFSSYPAVTIDLLLDRRPLVRWAAVQALAKTNNSEFAPFLWETLDDREPLVAEAAARAVANAPDVVAKTFEHSMSGFDTNVIARVWAFMPRDKRIELLQRIFSKTAAPRTPPPPVAPRPKKPGVSVKVTEMTPVRPGMIVGTVLDIATDPNVQIGALTLLTSISPEEFKLPLARVMEAKYDPMIAVALQVGNERGEALPLDALIKLVASSNEQVSRLAIQSLAFSAAVSDIPRIEALISKDGSKKVRDDELKLTVKKIRFRSELSAAKTPAQSREIIARAMSDFSLGNFAWRYDCENSISGCTPQTAIKRDLTIKPFGENLFPQHVRHFTAIPQPRQAVQKFYETLHGLQMDSPRAQSNLVLMMGSIRQQLGEALSAPIDATSLIEYTGVDPDAPIALAAWTATGAADTAGNAQRKAIVLRVKDRARFERAIAKFQEDSGEFTNLTHTVAVGTRAIAALPAILPFTAQAILAYDPSKTASRSPLLNYSFVTDKEWNGLPIKTIEHRWINSKWEIETASTHIVYIGDTVLLTPDVATIRDLLTNVNSETRLAGNAEFRKAIESRGDIVYFSDLARALAEFSATINQPTSKGKERGALNISASSWENSHHFVFEESDWVKSLIPFHPKELSAPRDLLPASTIAYYLMKVDVADMVARNSQELLSTQPESIANLWAIDFKQEVLPELGPECGFVLLELPDLQTLSGGAWAGFCKLKSNKLADALLAGKLLRGVGPTTGIAEIKSLDVSYYVAVRNGFLVLSNSKGLAAFDGKSNLASARDYSRAVEKVPNGIIAFGGYNLEASVAAASKTTAEGVQQEVANILFSVSSAFHSQNFYATATDGTVTAHSSVAMDREGRYPVADLSYLPRGTNITFMTLEPSGIPITDQKRLSSMTVRVRAKTSGPIDNIKNDIKTDDQTVEQKTANELLLTIGARRSTVETSLELPVKDPALEPFLKATREFASDNEQVKAKAAEIADKDKDAWSVARKLADWTHQNLEWKLVASAGAATTLATREADCTEFSQLFIAMARSLGLPARMVEGIAYSGNSFGGHAWVEVWVGKWVELDPTWGTHFVDATHIRSSSNAIITSAALNMIEMEVLETKRTAADFQKNPRALAEHLAKAIPTGNSAELEAALDLTTLTDEFMGAGTWAKMNEREREQMSSAYRRLVNEIEDYGDWFTRMYVVHLEEKGDHAEALCLLQYTELLLRLKLVRRNDIWYLAEVIVGDDSYYIAAETLRPTIETIEKTRAGQKPPPLALSEFVRVRLLVQSDSPKAIPLIDGILKNKPKDQALRYLKASALLRQENGKTDGVNLLKELSDEKFAPGVFRLARQFSMSDDKAVSQQAIPLYEHYTQLEPHDPRGFSELAEMYEETNEVVKAEAALRKVIELNPANTDNYESLIEFLISRDRFNEIKPWLDVADKHADKDDDIFASIMQTLVFEEDFKNAEAFAASEPVRLKKSFLGNLTLGRVYSRTERYPAALRAFETAAQLDPKSAVPYADIAMTHRKQARWAAALKSAQKAIDLEHEYSEGYYQRACALARLGKIKEAMASLVKAVELDSEQVDYMVDEEDLKPLASLPDFKKLIPEPVKQ